MIDKKKLKKSILVYKTFVKSPSKTEVLVETKASKYKINLKRENIMKGGPP